MSGLWILAYCLLALLLIVLAVFVRGITVRAIAALERVQTHLVAAPRIPAGGVEPGTRVIDRVAARRSEIADRLVGRRSIVLFLEPTCQPCQLLVEDMTSHPLELGDVALVPVLDGTAAGRELAARIPVLPLYQEQGEVSRIFATRSSPHAFAVNEDGVVIGVSVPNSVAQLVQMAARAWQGGGPEGDTPTSESPYSVVTT